MTDQTIPAGISPEEAKKAREWALHALNKPGASTTAEKAVARMVIGTVPEPRPTLADMTEEERDACQRMQADVENRDRRPVIVNPYWDDETARIMWPHGFIEEIDWERITPRPDLPRMEWPGNKKAEDVPPVKVGDVIESADDPRLAALPVWTVLRDIDGEEVTRSEGGPGTWRGTGYIPIPTQGTEFGPWTVRRIGLEADQ